MKNKIVGALSSGFLLSKLLYNPILNKGGNIFMSLYVGVNGTPKKVKKLFVGVNGAPKEVKTAYTGGLILQ